MAHQEHIHTIEARPADFEEPFSGKPFDRAYGAMPANPFKDETVKARQASIESEFLKLFVTPPAELAIPKEFQDLFTDDYVIGERRRQMTNFNNYMEWRKKYHYLNKDLLPLFERYESATAEVEDVIDIALHTNIQNGLEVGRVTHPYWQRMEYVLDLRRDTAEVIQNRGGRLEPWISPYRSISIVPYTNNGEVAGFIVPYKHDLGSIIRPGDGKVLHVVERQIAGIRVDEASGFSQGVLRRMHDIAKDKPDFDWANTGDERFEYHLRNTGARGFIEKAIQTDSTEEFLVPESTTIYVFAEDPEVSKALGRAAFLQPDADIDGLAYYNAKTRVENKLS